MDKIDNLRQQIDSIDDKVMKLLNDRFELTNEIGRIKSKSKISVMDNNRENLKSKYPDFITFNKKFQITEEMLKELVAQGDKEGVEHTEKEYLAVKEHLRIHLKALLARDLWDGAEYYQIVNQNNEILNKALELLKNPRKFEDYLK